MCFFFLGCYCPSSSDEGEAFLIAKWKAKLLATVPYPVKII